MDETPNLEELSAIVLNTAYGLHRDLGPGLLESAYEAILAKLLQDQGLSVARQTMIPINFAGLILDEGFRADLIVGKRLVVELKSVDRLVDVHYKQLLTYLKLMHLPLGLLINFGGATFKENVKRIANHHQDSTSSRLRIHQAPA
jgi:GxxExxY protein